MMTRGPRPGAFRARAFTLIEVLVAIAIFAMISTLIMTSFSSLQRSKEGVRRISERYRQGRMALSRMSRELQSAYISHHVPIDPNLLVWRTAFIAERDDPADRVSFVAFAHRRLDRDAHESDQMEVSYYSLPSDQDDGSYDLIRRFSPKIDLEPETGGRAQVLATDIESLRFQYLDALTGLWSEDWDSTEAIRQYDRLPLQVKIDLVLRGGQRDGSGDRGTLTFSTKVGLPMQRPLEFAIQ